MMAADMKKSLEQLYFVCILSDSSTEHSTNEEEIVYTPVVVSFLGLSKNAPGILDSILKFPKMIGFGADGVNEMMGFHNGVPALIKE